MTRSQKRDMIETGEDGSVVIELVHNLARWELGPNKHVVSGFSKLAFPAVQDGIVTVVYPLTFAPAD